MCESMLTFSTKPFKFKVYAAAGTLFNLNSRCGTFFLLDKRDVYLMGQHFHFVKWSYSTQWEAFRWQYEHSHLLTVILNS